jgi:hypothetical protein
MRCGRLDGVSHSQLSLLFCDGSDIPHDLSHVHARVGIALFGAGSESLSLESRISMSILDTLRHWNRVYDALPEPIRFFAFFIPLVVGLTLGLVLGVWIQIVTYVLALTFRLPVILVPRDRGGQ